MGRRAAFIASIAALLCAAPAAQAATFTVTGTGDGGFCDRLGNCASLRAAIAAAEATKEEADTINVPAGVINIGSDLVVQSEMTIVGASARTTIVDGGAKYRGFRVTTSGVLTLRNFTIRDGAAGGGDINHGGGILNQGGLGLQDVRVTDSRAVRGGGIANAFGRLTADNLLVDNNVASGAGGGGIHNTANAEVTNFQGLLFLTDATIFKNAATGKGGVGGIDSTGTGAWISLSRSTIADNVGGDGGVGGLWPTGSSSAVGSIIARNVVGGDLVNCGDAKPGDGHFNVEDDKDCNLAPGGMKPGLATGLSNEGGQLDVLAISASGDAFNRMPLGDTPCEGTDQRGTARPQGAACDAGAFELAQAATVTITEGPSGTVTSSDVEFRFQDSGGDVTVQCDLTGPGQTAGFETCYKSNAQPYADLADGPYTFSVRAVSAAFPDPKPTTRSFVVNTAPPTTSITGGPSGATNDSTPTFTFTSSEAGSTFECAVDSGAFAACTSAHTVATQSDGGHTFRVRARDAAGTLGNTATHAFTVDTVAPDTTIGSGPSGPTPSTTATFTFTSNEPAATFQCSLDGGAFGACPVSYTGLAQGAHTFQVRAVDAAGNTDASPATRTWTVDTTVPETSITGGPSGPTKSTTATFTFTSNEPAASFQCSLDGAAFGSCPSSYTGLAQGNHTFAVRARDAALNTDQSPATQTWTVDTIAPPAPVIVAPAQGALLNVRTIDVNGTAQASATVRLTEGATNLGSSIASGSGLWNVIVAPVSDGTHTYTAVATDAAGNESAAATRTFRVDATMPNTTITSGPSGQTNTARPAWTFTSSETPQGFECSLDGAAHTTCQSPFTPTSDLSQGPHTFSVRAVDQAGNRDNTPETRTITVDTVAPTLTLIDTPPTRSNDTTPTFTWNAEAGATVECKLDSGNFAVCSSGYTPSVTEGTHTVQVRATDAATNVTIRTHSWITDTTRPDTTITGGSPSPTNDTTPEFTFAANETGSTFECRVGGGDFVACSSPHSTAALVAGSHAFEVRATDAAGNLDLTPASRIIEIDTTPPNATITGTPSAVTNDSTATFAFDAEAGATFQCAFDGAAFMDCASPFTGAALADGAHTFAVRALDRLDNAGPAATYAFTVDTAPPAGSVTSGPEGATTDANPAFAFTASETTTECRLDGPGGPGTYAACVSPKTFSALAPGAYEFFVRVTDPAGNQTETRRGFTVTQTQGEQPTPTPTPTPTPPPEPTPVPDRTIVVAPATGTVLVKLKGQRAFEPLDVTKGIPNGSEVDVRKGRVTLTSIPKAGAPAETADFYGGMFVVNQRRGITDLKLSERLTGCPKGQQASASTAQKKPRKRRLWGKGKGAFRTTGKYSAATVRGTTWLVEDTCTRTLTRVTQGVVQVNDFVKKKKKLVKKGKRYTAKAKRR